MSKKSAVPKWQRSFVALTATVIGVVVVATLYWAQVVFIPVGMALFLAFLLTPLVRGLQRRAVPRVASVGLVVLGTALIVTSSFWVIGKQLAELAVEIPTYSTNIRQKIRSIRTWGTGSNRLTKMIEEVGGELKTSSTKPDEVTSDVTHPNILTESGERPTSVVLEPKTPPWLERLPAYLRAVLESLGSLALALVLLIFMLLNREDLRARFLRLVGHGRLSATTKAVDDAGQRISKYLLMQVIVNGTFGLAFTLGLFLIGVEYALLWGFIAAVLRYIPYVGAWIAAVFPIVLSLAMFNTWWPPLAVLGLVLTLELSTANLVEPLLFGQSMGISAVAQLVSAAFWAFLWGPIGLVLSAPLTFVLLVLGKYVPQLEFLDVMLGDEPALEPDIAYYQRLLARDQDEAVQLVLATAKSSSAEQVYDNLLVPALNYAKRDHAKDDLTDADHQFILQTNLDVLEDLSERRAEEVISQDTPPVVEIAGGPNRRRLQVLACPARDESDRLGLLMLQRLVACTKWEVEFTAIETLTSEVVAQLAKDGQTLVCIGSLPPGGLTHTRYLCKRLRSHFPRLKILVGRWGLRGNVESNQQQLQEAGADLVATTLLETRNQMESLYSIL